MKRFKEFIKKKVVDPILITAQPMHGSHAHPPKDVKIEEAVNWLGKKYNQPRSHNSSEWLAHNENKHIYDDVDHHKRIAAILADQQSTFGRHHPHYEDVESYTDSSYSLNKHLIQKANGTLPPSTDDEVLDRRYKKEDQAKRLDSTIKEHKLHTDVHLYHGAGFNPGKEAAKHPKGHIKIPTFLSTSHNKGVSYGFTHQVDGTSHILHIHAKKGTHGLYIGNRTIGDEHETLLPRNQVLRVHPQPTHLSDGTKVWHAKIVDQPFDG